MFGQMYQHKAQFKLIDCSIFYLFVRMLVDWVGKTRLTMSGTPLIHY